MPDLPAHRAGAKPDTYQVHEMFWSIQGEGVAHLGWPSHFLRLQGCPIGCEWCDAKLTWYGGGTSMTTSEIALALYSLPYADHLIITGGEPLIWNLDPLFTTLGARYATTQIETSGALPMKGQRWPTTLTVSPKYTRRFEINEQVLRRARELKYVVDEHFTEAVAISHVEQWRMLHEGRDAAYGPKVSLMPEGSPPRPEMVERTLAMLRRHPHWFFSPRLQYAYSQVAEIEGDTNEIISQREAKERSREHHRSRV